jgi:solute:Na+ symporter, SSS family
MPAEESVMEIHNSQSHIFSALHFYDWVVFYSVLLVTAMAALLARSRLKSKGGLTEYLVMGRRMTLPFFVFTLVSSWYGGIFGVTEIAFEKGVYNFVTQGLFWYVSYILFAIFIVNKARQTQAITFPQLISSLYGPKAGRAAAVLNFFNVLPIAYVISMGLFIQSLSGLPFWSSTMIGLGFVVAYSASGGLRADVYTDVVQFFVMCTSVLMVLLFSVFTWGGFDFLTTHLPATHFSPTAGEPLLNIAVWGFIALSTLVDPCFYQRCFAAESTRTARTGILISTLIWFAFDICTTLGGMYARAVIPDASPKDAYLIYSLSILPIGFKGLFLSGVLATILSTVDTFIFIASTTLSFDLSKKGHLENRFSISRQTLFILFTSALTLALVYFFDGSIKLAWKTMGSLFAATLLPLTLLGFFGRWRLTENEFITSLLLGSIATITWKLGLKWNWITSSFWSLFEEFYAGAAVTLLVTSLFYLRNRTRCKTT